MSYLSEHKIDQMLLQNLTCSKYINAPKTEEYIINNRGQRLHVRSTIPTESIKIKAAILSLHGYGSHSNRPPHLYLANKFVNAGYIYITMDFHGHGYSEGERGLVENHIHLVDDALCVLISLYKNKTDNININCNLSKIPFYIMGHSMGGGIAILLSTLLSNCDKADELYLLSKLYKDNEHVIHKNIVPYFRGSIFICPAICINAPFILRCCLLRVLSCIIPKSSLPVFIFNENKYNHLVWTSSRYREYLKQDGYPSNPNGLNYGGNIMFRTLISIMLLGENIQNIITYTNFPFIILHDSNGDIVVPVNGSIQLIDKSPSKNKIFIDIVDGLHDILDNKVDETSEILVDWLEKQMYKQE